MGLDTIINDILEKAKAESETILNEAQTEANKILTDAEKEAAKLRERQEEAARKDVERLKQQEISGANLEIKRELLNARKDLLDETYAKAIEQIKNIPEDKNAKILETILKKHATQSDRIYSNEKDKKLITSLCDNEHAGIIDCIGGVMIETSDGNARLDYTYDTILKDVNETSLKQVSQILFG